jgi:hypothetical protein
MIRILMHPGDRRLNQFADGGLRLTDRRRVAAHLVRCHRCRGEVDAVRTLGESVRAIRVPEPSVELLDRILAKISVGEAVILPDPLPTSAGRRRWSTLRRISALLAVLLGGSLLVVRTPNLTAYRSTLELSPMEPGEEASYRVTYEGGLRAPREGSLLLRARLFNGRGQVEHRTLATLARNMRGRFTGEFSLPETIVYGIFAVEDTTGGTIDFDPVAPWEVLARDRRGRPLYEALREKAREEFVRDRAAGLRTAEAMTEFYPERVGSWYTRYNFERVLRGVAHSDSLRREHYPRFLALERELRRSQAPDADDLAHMAMYALVLGDLTRKEYWARQLMQNAPLHPVAVTLRVQELESEFAGDPRQLLAELERLWTELGTERRDVAAAAFAAAGSIGERSAIIRWADRYIDLEPEGAAWVASELARIPVTRQDAIQRLRAEIERPVCAVATSRDLFVTTEKQRRIDELRARTLKASLGAAMIAHGDKDAGVRTLRAAVEAGWDPATFRAGADALLSQGDTLSAFDLLVSLAADPATDEATRELIRNVVRQHDGAVEWRVLIRKARERMRQQLLAEALNRPLRRDLPLVDLAGGHHELGALLEGHVTLISLWYCACKVDEANYQRFGEFARELMSLGVRVIVVASGIPPQDLDRDLRTHGIDLPVYGDSRGTVAWEFRMSGTPQYSLVGPDVTLRFENTTEADVIRQALALLPEMETGGN